MDGGILYATMAPCTRCAGSIIQSGIREIIYLDPDLDRQIPGWRDSLDISFQMFEEAGVKYKSLGTAQDMMQNITRMQKINDNSR